MRFANTKKNYNGRNRNNELYHIGYVYMFYRQTTGERYIGITKNLKQRLEYHRKSKRFLFFDLSILAEYEDITRGALRRIEQGYIKYYNANLNVDDDMTKNKRLIETIDGLKTRKKQRADKQREWKRKRERGENLKKRRIIFKIKK
jgi:hypothetical protein